MASSSICSFTNQSSGTIDTYAWTFGDETFSGSVPEVGEPVKFATGAGGGPVFTAL